MLKEVEKDQLDYVILGNTPRMLIEGDALPGPKEKGDRELQDFVTNSLLELGRGMSRYSIREVPPIIASDLRSSGTIAEALSKVKVDDPRFKDLDPITDEGITEIGEIAIAKAEAAKETVTDSKAKSKLTEFEEKIARGVHKPLNTRGKLIKRAIGAGLSLALVACADGIVLPTVTSDTTPGGPTTTEVTPAETATGPTATGPTATEVSPTFTEAPTDTETPTPTDTETPTPSETPQIPFENGPSREFSALYPAEWHNKWTGKVAGMDIPIIVGLAYDVVHDTKYPITPFIGVTITQGGADAVADAFLRASHYRYTKLMGNNVTYEQYLELLKQPTCGEVLMMITDDTGVRREAWINPRQGVSVLIGDNIDSKLGVKFYTGTKVFFGVDGQGRLLIATDLFKSGSFDPYYKNNIEIADDSFIYNNFTALNYFGSVKNSCMVSGDSLNACGVISATTEINDFWQQLRAREKTQLANGKNLDFDIVRP